MRTVRIPKTAKLAGLIVTALAIMVMSLLLSGCGDNSPQGDGGGSSPPPSIDTSPTTPAPPSTVFNTEAIEVLLQALQAPTQGSLSATVIANRLNSLSSSWNVRPGELDDVAVRTCKEDKGALGKYVRYQLPGVDFRAWSALQGLVDLVTATCNVRPDIVEELRSDLTGQAFAGSASKVKLPTPEADTVLDRACRILQQVEDPAVELLKQLIELGSHHHIQPGQMFEFIAGAAIKSCGQLVDTAQEVLKAA